VTAVLEAPPVLLGREEPRLWTPPARELTPDTTLGYEAIEFAERVVGVTLLPWQRWWLLHALELNEAGRYRFKTVLTLVGRQNGKTTLLKLVALWAMYMRRAHLVLGAAQSRDIAKESWEGAVELAESVPELADEVAPNGVRRSNGEQCLTLDSGARYRITAATRSAGRGLSVDLLVLDELREHRDWSAWGALSKTTMARPGALIVGISNAGDDQSVVLNTLRSAALSRTDPSIGIFEWSAPTGCELDDRQAWAQACPGLGRTIDESSIRTALATDPPAVFRTEILCQHVDSLESAVDPASWKTCADPSGSLAGVRDRLAVCLDVAPDGAHVTLAGAAQLDDGRTRAEVLGAWQTTDQARRELETLLVKLRPAVLAWFPNGPAAALGADLRALTSAEVVEIKGAEVNEACMSFADLVAARRIVHPSDPLLDAHVAGSQRLVSGDGWRLCRKGVGHVDAAYAAAGAVHAARTLPPPTKKPRSRIY
jgi:hypothetical protein